MELDRLAIALVRHHPRLAKFEIPKTLIQNAEPKEIKRGAPEGDTRDTHRPAIIARPRLLNPDHPTLADILDVVSQAYSVSLYELRSRSRLMRFTEPRHRFAWLATQLTTHSLPKIGKFIDRDHTTIISSVKNIEARLEQLRDELDWMKLEIGKIVTARAHG